jgi:hypothetical protein
MTWAVHATASVNRCLAPAPNAMTQVCPHPAGHHQQPRPQIKEPGQTDSLPSLAMTAALARTVHSWRIPCPAQTIGSEEHWP